MKFLVNKSTALKVEIYLMIIVIRVNRNYKKASLIIVLFGLVLLHQKMLKL